MVSPHFKKVCTIEIFEPLYQESLASFKNYDNIKALFGDSVLVLPTLYEDYKDGAVFYMDAHVSGWDSAHNPEHPVPLLKEINVINKKPIGPSLFIVDDLRLWKNGHWQGISNAAICSQFRPGQIKKAYEKNDRYWILTNQTFGDVDHPHDGVSSATDEKMR
ncbi:hypothetical protein [carnivorous sponge associated iridovirus]|jgi:hypothetical protein|nr:hypothetical protein [carnivorous sponge associated iridovirus]